MSGFDEKGRLWAEIDLDALVFNYRQGKKHAGGAKVLTIMKADGYGHGAVECARALEAEGADYFGVAAPEEALELRAAGIKTPILLLGVAPDCLVEALAAQDVDLAVNSLETARRLAGLAGGHTIKAQVQLDTGMSRLGLETLKGVERAGEELVAISRVPGIALQGLWTHLCVADVFEEDDYTREQIRLFRETAGYAKARGVEIPLCHCANSSAMYRFPEARFDMVRMGILLYGVSPDDQTGALFGELKPVMSLRSRVMQVRTIGAGTTVGYGRAWTAPRETDIAVIGFGYSDGIPRLCSGKIQMAVHGKRVPQVGRICMDLCMLDVTEAPCARGDIVTILGRDGDETIAIEELAAPVSTSPHEIFANISKRVPRIYYRDGAAVARALAIL